ncbi:hypothetical protein RUM44_013159 [Polyplax serrata]|uniref:Uncharacterized protein n=1 Tax=Polyplax serrata TaxID=468196 RepID=A0ABR1BDC3_POLSC
MEYQWETTTRNGPPKKRGKKQIETSVHLGTSKENYKWLSVSPSRLPGTNQHVVKALFDFNGPVKEISSRMTAQTGQVQTVGLTDEVLTLLFSPVNDTTTAREEVKNISKYDGRKEKMKNKKTSCGQKEMNKQELEIVKSLKRNLKRKREKEEKFSSS